MSGGYTSPPMTAATVSTPLTAEDRPGRSDPPTAMIIG